MYILVVGKGDKNAKSIAEEKHSNEELMKENTQLQAEAANLRHSLACSKVWIHIHNHAFTYTHAHSMLIIICAHACNSCSCMCYTGVRMCMTIDAM